MRDLNEESLQRLVATQEARNASLSRTSKLGRDELDVLENFWNPFLHKRRDAVPLIAVLDREGQKITTRRESPAAAALVRARIKALMMTGYIYEDLLEWYGGKVPSGAELQWSNEGVAYFAGGFPAALRNPLLFANRHLSLFQLVGVIVSVTLAIATFVLRVLSGA